MNRVKVLSIVVLSLLVATLWVSAPVNAHSCEDFTVSVDYGYSYGRLSEETDHIRWTVRTGCNDYTLDENFMEMKYEVSITLDGEAKEWKVDQHPIGYRFILETDTVDKEPGTWELISYHNGWYHCFAGVYHDNDTDDTTLIIPDDEEELDSTLTASEINAKLSDSYKESINLDSRYEYYPIYERISTDQWGSTLDRAIMPYIMPSGGYYDVGDTKPMVYLNQSSETLKIVIGKQSGDHLVLRFTLDDERDIDGLVGKERR